MPANPIALRVASNYQDRLAKRKTFNEARTDILAHLKKEGWKVVDGLKVPHATRPDGKARVYFKTQAVYIDFSDRGGRFELNHARSMWVDIRTMDPHVFEKAVEDADKHQ